MTTPIDICPPIVGRIYPIPTDMLSPVCIYNTICRIQIIQGPNVPGPNLPGPNLPRTFSEWCEKRILPCAESNGHGLAPGI